MPQTPSTRWCPTSEQLMILEEMYRSGVRTPNAAEIQQITAHLAYYGRIEGKNVFYWFQNHKARERQRLRRRLCARHQQQYAQQQQPPSTAPNASAALATVSAGGSGGGVHPAVLQLHHHHHPYTSSGSVHHGFMPQGYFQQDAATLPLPSMDQVNAGKICECMDPNNTCTAYDQDWAHMVDCSGSTAGSSDDAAIPPCCRPLKTLELFPTKSTGLKDECSSSKSSSCSTSTN